LCVTLVRTQRWFLRDAGSYATLVPARRWFLRNAGTYVTLVPAQGARRWFLRNVRNAGSCATLARA
jgi:hypothetical protein